MNGSWLGVILALLMIAYGIFIGWFAVGAALGGSGRAPGTWALVVTGGVAILALVAGLAKARFPLAPRLVGLAVGLGYLTHLAVVTSWTARCADCSYDAWSGDATRGFVLFLAVWYSTVMASFILAAMYIGTRLAQISRAHPQ